MTKPCVGRFSISWTSSLVSSGSASLVCEVDKGGEDVDEEGVLGSVEEDDACWSLSLQKSVLQCSWKPKQCRGPF